MRRRKKTLSLGLAATAVVTATIAGVSLAATPDTAEARSVDTLRWGPCAENPKEAKEPKEPEPSRTSKEAKEAEEPGQGDASRLECASLQVPLDYQDPDGRQIDIAVSRLPSEKPAKRRGVLLVNPGGPGITSLGYPYALAASGLPQEVRDSYDLIGFDPRGVGRSTRVTCDLTEKQQAHGNIPPYTRNAADVAKEAPYARAVAEQCAASKSSWMLPHVTTANSARDMDRIRAALGEPNISYLGGSYGTQLGSVYATLFPRRDDRIVLDSNLGPGGYDVTAMRMLARGMEDRFPDFAAYAAAHPEYGLGTTPQQVTAKFHELARRLDEKPVQGYNGTVFRGKTLDNLYTDAGMATLAKTWQALDTNKPLPDDPSLPDFENFMAARFHTLCNDSLWPRSIATYQRNAEIDRVRYPKLGGSTAGIGPCAFWPTEHTERTEPPVRVGAKGPSNVLMVQNERDPGTPLAGAKKLRHAFGHRAVMVTADQGGHGVYPSGTNRCANDAVTTYLTTGKRPSQDINCPAEQPST
ncbi:alpha/beta hydrolase [Streptomyces sp. NPDC059897]|uniref:alpha/beta hydrolase n=1 Tax=Streptomyces sp. NPDC059897 TaxID=3346994 RepID=UPI0036467732